VVVSPQLRGRHVANRSMPECAKASGERIEGFENIFAEGLTSAMTLRRLVS
jgi:hypothetical protein